MPDWIVEEGIGETRAALVEGNEILGARVRREGVVAAGAVLDAKLVAVAPRVTVEANDEQFFLPRGVSGLTEGARLAIEVRREAAANPGSAGSRVAPMQRQRRHRPWQRAPQAPSRLGTISSKRRGPASSSLRAVNFASSLQPR